MSRQMQIKVPPAVVDHRRRTPPPNDRRVGVQSRRQVRHDQAAWMRRHWRLLVAVVVVTGALCAGIELLAPDLIAPYIVGGLVVSSVWLVHVTMLETTGMARRRAGILGEQWTETELRRLRRHDWLVVDHVMFDHGDVDHVLMGPGGFFAVGTAFRSDWTDVERELRVIATAATVAAHRVRTRVGRSTVRVQPIVVMWGPNLKERYPQVFELDGVTFCPGHCLREHVLALPREIRADQVAAAYNALDQYVGNRDRARSEAARSGPVPREVREVIRDFVVVLLAAVLAALATVAPARWSPVGVWSAVAGTAVVCLAVAVRRRSAGHTRVLGVTTAVIASALGFAVLMAAAGVAHALR